MILYHASNAAFDKFDLSYVKSGAEKTKYGYGFYFASSKDDAQRHCRELIAKKCYVYECKIYNSDHIVDFYDMIDEGIFHKIMFLLSKMGYEEDVDLYTEEFEEYGNGLSYGDVYSFVSSFEDDKFASKIFDKVGITGFEVKKDLVIYENPIYVIFNPENIKMLKVVD